MLWLAASRVTPLPDRIANAVPGPDRPRAPPAAFQTVADLSGRDGHLFIVEYCEEHPVALSNPGMGARRVLWYRKLSSSDEPPGRDAALGAEVLPLEPGQHSPFLPELAPGARAMCLETKMARCSLWEHAPQRGDFILFRSAAGRLYLRSATRTGVVGHCEPHVAGEVPYPREDEVAKLKRCRMELTIYRKLRACRAAGAPETVDMEALREELPYNWAKGSLIDKLVRSILRYKPREDVWIRQPGVDIPSEEVLRALVSPEAVCTFESMQAAHVRLRDIGITGLGLFNHKTTLMTAVNALPREPAIRTTAALIRLELSLMPWAQTSAFIDMLRGRGALQMDSSKKGAARRGHYIHFQRKAVRNSEPDEKRARALELQPKAIQGTTADLRRLSMAECAAELRRLGMVDDEIALLERWARVRWIRKLSADVIEDGASGKNATLAAKQARWARVERQSVAYLRTSNAETATKLFERLNRMCSAAGGGGGDDDDAGEGEGEGEGEGDGDDAPTDSDDEDLAKELEEFMLEEKVAKRKEDAAVAAAARERERADAAAERRDAEELRAMLAGGGEAAAAASAAAAAAAADVEPPTLSLTGPLPGLPEGAPGTRLRLRRVVTVYHPGGRVEKLTDVITSPAVLRAYTATKEAEGDTVSAVLTAMGPDGYAKLPFPLRGVAQAARVGRYMRADLKARRDKEKQKKVDLKASMAAEQFVKMKAARLEGRQGGLGHRGATVMADGLVQAGGLIAPPQIDETGMATTKVKFLFNTSLDVADKLKPRKEPKAKKEPGQRRYRRTPAEMAIARGEAPPPDDDEPSAKRGRGDDDAAGPVPLPRSRLNIAAAALAADAVGDAARQAFEAARGDAPVAKREVARESAVRAAHAAGRSDTLSRFAINDVLLRCLNKATSQVKSAEIHFMAAVNASKPNSKNFVPDYTAFVPDEKANVGISRMRTKCTAAQPERSYASADELLLDARRLAASTRAYHDPPAPGPRGKFAKPALPPIAEAFERALRTELEAHGDALAKARSGPWPAPKPLPAGAGGGDVAMPDAE
jgi:hypothetical protein